MFKFDKVEFAAKVRQIFEFIIGFIHRKNLKKISEGSADAIIERRAVSELILAVLTGKMLTREALLRFPKDSKDLSVKTSWMALCHLEADEDMRCSDFEYAQEQNDYLEMIAFILKRGDELPDNIIESYKLYHEEPLIPHRKGFRGIIANLMKFLNIT